MTRNVGVDGRHTNLKLPLLAEMYVRTSLVGTLNQLELVLIIELKAVDAADQREAAA